MSEEPLIQAAGQRLSAADLVRWVRLGPGEPAARELLFELMAAARAEKEGVQATDEDVDREVDRFHVEHDLFEPEDIEAWYRRRRLNRAEVREVVRRRLLLDRLKRRLAPDEDVAARFRKTMHDHARVTADVLTAPSQGAASELLLSLREGEISWGEAAQRAGGSRRVELKRTEAPEDTAAQLFSAEMGAQVGPSWSEEGYELYRVVSREVPRLTEELRESIRDEIFREKTELAFARDPLKLL